MPADSTTSTFAALQLTLDNWRWARAVLRAHGQRLSRKGTEISIHFKPTPHLMFAVENGGRWHNNILTFCLQPNEGIVHTFGQTTRARHLPASGHHAFSL